MDSKHLYGFRSKTPIIATIIRIGNILVEQHKSLDCSKDNIIAIMKI